MAFSEDIIGNADAGGCQHPLLAVIEREADPHPGRPEEGSKTGAYGRPDLAEPGAEDFLLPQANKLGMKPDRKLVNERLAVGARNIHVTKFSAAKRGSRRFELERDAQASCKKVHGAGWKYRKRLVAVHQLASGTGHRAIASANHDDVAVPGKRRVKRVLDFFACDHGHHHLMARLLHRFAQACGEHCKVECAQRSAFTVKDYLEAHRLQISRLDLWENQARRRGALAKLNALTLRIVPVRLSERLIFFESEPDRRWPRCRVVKVTSGPPLRKFGSGRDRAKEHAQGEFNMIRNLLATTAIATLIATGAAVAQTTAPAPAADAPMEAAPQPQVKHAEGHLASNLIGETVYNGSGEGAENIGEVKDLVLDSEGNIQAIVVGVGGFLGIGEKQVALQYDLVEWTEMDGEEYIVVETTREALEAQQEFDLAAYEMQPADAEVGNTQPATAEDLAAAPVADDEAGMTGDTAAPTDDMAAAPAPAGDDMAATEEAAPADDMAATEEAAPADDMAASEEVAPAGEETAAAPADDTMTETDETQTSAIDRSSLNEVQVGDISADDFVGTTVYGANDENIGEIGDVILSDDGQVEAVIIDVGGFLGIGEKEVAVSMDNLAFLSDADGEYYLYTTFTQEQLEAQAAYDEGSFAENRDDQLLTVQ